MRAVAAAIGATAAVLAVSSILGVASAEGPTTTPQRTVSVQGVAIEPIAQGATAAIATGVYRQAMAAAVEDGHAKAEFLAAKSGATLGPVQSIAEGGGGISCQAGETRYVEYEGEQPDFGYGTISVGPAATSAPAVKGAPAPLPLKRHRRHRTPSAKVAAVSCALDTQVSLVYAIS
jgi:hypothetical protein